MSVAHQTVIMVIDKETSERNLSLNRAKHLNIMGKKINSLRMSYSGVGNKYLGKRR
jgi:hypothetical protein